MQLRILATHDKEIYLLPVENNHGFLALGYLQCMMPFLNANRTLS